MKLAVRGSLKKRQREIIYLQLCGHDRCCLCLWNKSACKNNWQTGEARPAQKNPKVVSHMISVGSGDGRASEKAENGSEIGRGTTGGDQLTAGIKIQTGQGINLPLPQASCI